MQRPRTVQLIALLLCVALVYGATRLTPGIDAGRAELNLFGDESVLENTPPEYAFAIQAFGAFRSLIVNIAFIRAETLKEEGRYYDAMQLASWICKLQPRFPSVWSFQSWNMAWNISVTTFTPEERWNWVYNGLKLLRDEGIPMNPRAINLYKQLAWIYNNKMSENLDDHHWNYKRYWAWRMHLVLGPRLTALREFRPDPEFQPVAVDVDDDPLARATRAIAEAHEARREAREENEFVPHRTTKTLEERLADMAADQDEDLPRREAEITQKALFDYIKSVADAPRSLTELYERFPETADMVTALRDIDVIITDDELTEDAYWYHGKLAATFFARYRRLVDTPSLEETMGGAAESSTVEDEARARLDEIIGARAGNPAGRALVRFLQRKVLSEVYKLDPDLMVTIVESFGPVDWRMVDAHSLYWVVLGLQRGGETPQTFQTDKLNTARLIFFSLRNLFHRNKIRFEPVPDDIPRSYINFSRDVDFVEPMHQAYITYGPMLDPDPGDATGAGSVFRTGHINFLTEAIRMLYFADRIAEAEHYYEYLRTHYGRKTYTNELELKFTMPLRDYVLQTLYGDIEGPRATSGVINDLLFRAYNELADENVTSYNRYVTKARELHTTYSEEKSDYRTDRMKLLPFWNFQVDVFHSWLAMPAYSPSIAVRKAHLWRVAPLQLRQWVYDDLLRVFTAECEAWGFHVDRAFPEPPGMEAFRESHPTREAEKEEGGAETPAQAPG